MGFARLWAALLLALPAVAHAQQWTRYAADRNGAVSYYDPSSLRREGTRVQVAVRRDFAPDPSQPQRTAVELWSYECADRTAAWLSFTTYDAAGAVMEQRRLRPEEVELKPVVPRSTGETLYEIVCRAGGGAGAGSPRR